MNETSRWSNTKQKKKTERKKNEIRCIWSKVYWCLHNYSVCGWAHNAHRGGIVSAVDFRELYSTWCGRTPTLDPSNTKTSGKNLKSTAETHNESKKEKKKKKCKIKNVYVLQNSLKRNIVSSKRAKPNNREIKCMYMKRKLKYKRSRVKERDRERESRKKCRVRSTHMRCART